MIILKIGNIETDIVGNVDASDFVVLKRRLSYRPEGYMFSPKFKMRMWDGWKRLIWKNSRRCYFPTGLLSIVREFFKEKNIEYRIVDCRIKPEKNIDLSFNNDKYKLRDYQQRVVDAAIEKCRGIIMSATGSGKTISIAGIIQRCSVKPFLILVTSIDLLEQTKERLEDALYHNKSNLKVGKIGDGVVDIRDVNVMTVQTAVRALGKKFVKFDSDSKDDKMSTTLLQKFKKEIVTLIKESRGVAGDECQHWKSEMCLIVTNAMENAYYKYGLSATPYRDQGDDLLIQSCFGKNICEINASELIQKKYLVKPNITFVHINPPASKFKNWQNIYKERVVEDEYYNELIANITKEYLKSGKHVLVLVQQIEHGKLLESLIEGSLFVYGNSPKKERMSALDKMRNGYIKCIVSTSIYDEGIDLRMLDTLVLGGGGKSPTRAMQRIGRVLRPFKGKTEANVVDFFIHEKYLEEHAKAREKMYRTEPEFNIKHVFAD